MSTRAISIGIEVVGSDDDMLQPYIDRALKIWMARGGGLTEFTETVDRGYGERAYVNLRVQKIHQPT